jgi:anti-sigma factor NepR-like protein
MSWGDFRNCASRMGRVLVGKPVPAVVELHKEAEEVTRIVEVLSGKDPNDVGVALKTFYDQTLREPVPEDFLSLLDRLAGAAGVKKQVSE